MKGSVPDGKPLKARKLQRKRLLSVWCPPALKRDVQKIAKFERREVSRIAAGLLRLGIGRYFELGDAALVAPLRKAMTDIFTPEGWIPEMTIRPQSERARRENLRASEATVFDDAIDEGKRHFETIGC